jgi:hypothetical protein
MFVYAVSNAQLVSFCQVKQPRIYFPPHTTTTTIMFEKKMDHNREKKIMRWWLWPPLLIRKTKQEKRVNYKLEGEKEGEKDLIVFVYKGLRRSNET